MCRYTGVGVDKVLFQFQTNWQIIEDCEGTKDLIKDSLFVLQFNLKTKQMLGEITDKSRLDQNGEDDDLEDKYGEIIHECFKVHV